MTYIERNGTPINDKTYSSVAEALEAFATPDWAGGPATEVIMVTGSTFRSRGLTYEVREGENPTQARADARAAAPVKQVDSSNRATAAQIRYLNTLGAKVPQGAWDAWVKPGMTKTDASRAIEALKNIATK